MATFVQLSDDEPAVDFATLVSELRHKEDEAARDALKEELIALVDDYQFKDLLVTGLFAEETLKAVLAQHPNDVDTVFNLAFSLLDQLAPEEAAELVPKFVSALTSSTAVPPLMLKLLNTFFNVLGGESEHRHVVFAALLKYALDTKQQRTLRGQFRHLESWLAAWPVTQAERADIYFMAFNVVRLNGNTELQHTLLLKYFRALEGADKETLATAKPYAASAAVAAVKGSGVSESDMLLSLAAVAQLDGDAKFGSTHELLRIVAREGVADFVAFADKNAEFLAEVSIDRAEAMSKMRTVVLCSLGASSGTLTYEQLQEALLAEDDTAVEEAVIAAVVSGHVDAKIDQSRRVVVVQRTAMRAYQHEQWKELKEKLDAWRESVHNVLTTVMDAREKM